MNELIAKLSGLWILAEDGRTPVRTDDVLTWGEFMEDIAKRLVGFDSREGGSASVSTVFYGLPRPMGEGKIAFFETLVSFKGSPEYVRLSATWEDAVEMHKALCAVSDIECKSIKE